MKPGHQRIHEACLQLCEGYIKREAPIVVQLQMVGETKLFKELDKKSVFKYAVDICGLTEASAYSFIAVGKSAKRHPCLQDAIVSRSLTVSKANRIVSILSEDNAEELAQYAINHSTREIEREVRRRSPKALVRSKIKPLTEDSDLLQASIPRKTTEDINRAQTLLAQKTSMHQGISETISLVFSDYVERHDPVRKAERARARQSKEISARPESVKPTVSVVHKRIPPTAEQKHLVDLRDQRKCTHIGRDGQRCGDDRWIHYHHIISVANGGSNEPENLTTLCSFHHDLVHQLSLAIEGQVSWLRSPQVEYGLQ